MNAVFSVKTRRFFGTFIVLALISLMLGIFVVQAQDEIPTDIEATLVLYDFGDANDRAIREAAIARFNETYPNVTVEFNFTPISTWSEYLQSLVTQIAGGNAPDLIHIATEGVQLAVDRELLLPLNSYTTGDEFSEALLADVDPTLTNSLSVDGELYLIPAAWNNMMIYYNTRIFEEAGIERPADDWTWDDFLAIAQQLTTEDQFGFAVPYFHFGLSPFFYSNGTGIMSEDLQTSNLDDPAMAESVQFIHNLVNVYGVAPDVEGANPYALFSNETVAMTGGGHWPIQILQANEMDTYDVVPWPQNNGNQGTVFGTDGWGISPESENPDLAWELIKELTSFETISETADIGVAIPARRSVAETDAFLAAPASADLFYASLEYARPVAAPANFNEMEGIFMRYMDLVMAGELTAEEAMAEAHDELSAALGN